MKVTIIVLDVGSSSMVTGKVLVSRGEIESLVNLVRVEAIETRSFLAKPSFWKASRYKTLAELPMSTIILLT